MNTLDANNLNLCHYQGVDTSGLSLWRHGRHGRHWLLHKYCMSVCVYIQHGNRHTSCSWHSGLQLSVSYPKAHSWTAIWSQSSSKCLVYASSSRTYSDTHIPNTGKLGNVEMGGNPMHDIISSMQGLGNTGIYQNLTRYRIQILLQSSRPLERSDGYDFPNMVTSHPGVRPLSTQLHWRTSHFHSS